MAKIPWKTVEEKIEEDLFNQLTPTQQQILDAEFEIKVLNTLMEVGLL